MEVTKPKLKKALEPEGKERSNVMQLHKMEATSTGPNTIGGSTAKANIPQQRTGQKKLEVVAH